MNFLRRAITPRMNAIELLEQQHKEVESLFKRTDEAKTPAQRRKLFEQIADALAVHCAIEEKLFYPAVFGTKTKDMLLESVEEHLGCKRIIADLIALPPNDERYKAKLTVLREAIEHHVNEEREDLFPKARKILDRDRLETLGIEMERMVEKLAAGAKPPRMRVPAETRRTPSLH